MKMRHGFVSNSSSSSFIVASANDKVSITVEIDLRSLSRKVVTDVTDLDWYLIDRYSESEIDDPNSHAGRIKLKAIQALADGKKIYFGSIYNDSDDPVELMLYRKGLAVIDSKDVNVFEG